MGTNSYTVRDVWLLGLLPFGSCCAVDERLEKGHLVLVNDGRGFHRGREASLKSSPLDSTRIAIVSQ